GQECNPDPPQLPRVPALEGVLTFLLLFAELLLADLVHGLLESGRIVAPIIDPAPRPRRRERGTPDEILHAGFGRGHLESRGHDVHRALYRVSRFGDAERAAIGNAARRLVRVDAIDGYMCGREVV